MADVVEWVRVLRWPLLVALALLAVVMLAPGGVRVIASSGIGEPAVWVVPGRG